MAGISPFSFGSMDSARLPLPSFHSSDVVPCVLMLYGMLVAFLGFRVSRFFCFTLGFVLGVYFVDDLFFSQTAIRHAGLPLIVITLVSLVSAVTFLLLNEILLCALLGYVLADFVIAADNGRVLGWGLGRWAMILVAQAAVLAAGRKNWTALTIISTAALGSFLTALGIDHFAGQDLSAVLFTASYFRELVGATTAAPECGAACWLLIFTWLAMTAIGCYVQTILIQLEQTRLVTERRRLADDLVFSSAFTYDTFANGKAAAAGGVAPSASVSSRATFNFFDPSRLPENLQPLHPVIGAAFEGLSGQFGFQAGSVANQLEHLLFLLGNVKSRPHVDAISRLHAKVFGNYLEWTTFLMLTPYCSHSASSYPSESSSSPAHARAASHLKLQEIALWLCIWGEAGSLRHLPECLCYIYHHMGAELHVYRDAEGKPKVGVTIPARRPGAFLSEVVTPIFDVLRVEKGDMETVFRNYDDWNEFFWNIRCLRFDFAAPQYYAALNDGGESGDGKGSGSRLLAARAAQRASVSEGMRAACKTHLERRSWLHPARSFMRIISFYFTIFHILVCLAYCKFRQWPLLGPETNKAISSFVISLAAWSIVKELVEVWAQFGIIAASAANTAGFIMRLGIKTVAFGYLLAFFEWSYSWSPDYYHAYLVAAVIYLTPYLCLILAQIFPALSLSPSASKDSSALLSSPSLPPVVRRVLTAITHLWYPSASLYVGRDVDEPKVLTYQYQLFWICLLAWKFYCSFLFQVTPLIEPTFHILTAKPKWTHIWKYNEIAEVTSIFILWIPFVLVYMFDTVIWYFMFQAVIGVLVGMRDRIGEIREFSALVQAFTSLPWEFEKKLLAWRTKEPQSVDPSPYHRGEAGSWSEEGHSDESRALAEEYDLPALVDQFRTTAWQNFAVAWNEVIEDLRHDDLLSNAEKQLLVFRMVKGSRKELYIPILLTAGVYENAVEKVADLAFNYTQNDTDANKRQCTDTINAYLAQPIRREGIFEIWECTQWLLSSLLGERHEKDLDDMYQAFTSIATGGQMLGIVQGSALVKLKPALLNFVRGLRIAAASFTTFREQEAKKRAAREGERRERQRELEKEMVSESDSEDESSPSSNPSSLHPLHHSRTDKVNLKTILKSPSVGTLSLLDTIRSLPRYQTNAVVVVDDEDGVEQQYVVLHLNLIRDQLQQLLNALSALVKGSSADTKTISERCKAILVDHHGFSWDDAYAGKCVHTVLKSSKTSTVLTTLHAHLTVAQIDAEPSNTEATRRLLFFANSLFMHIPSAPSIASMKSFSTLTPFHSEDVLYSFADLEKQTEDGVSVFYYLQTIYPSEWANFLQRVGIADDRVASILHSRKTMEAREWATNRGQTLGRTIDGMMLYEKALRLLAKLEQPTLYDVEIDEMVKQKFQYLVSAQVYGKQKRESDPKATEIDIYLRKYPNMRVAYIDTLKVPKHDAHGKHTVVDEYYSVLIKAEQGEIKEVFRVQLPGNPILGEGKPENQNQAIIFTRGEYLQTIDMNQSVLPLTR